MEPVFFALGQAAGTAAALAAAGGSPVQDVPYAALRKRLVADGQVIELAPPVLAAEEKKAGWTDVCDTPYWETIDAVREMGGRMYQIRAGVNSGVEEEKGAEYRDI